MMPIKHYDEDYLIELAGRSAAGDKMAELEYDFIALDGRLELMSGKLEILRQAVKDGRDTDREKVRGQMACVTKRLRRAERMMDAVMCAAAAALALGIASLAFGGWLS